MATKLMTLDDFLRLDDQLYLHEVPSTKRQVKLRRLTHGDVRQFNQEVQDAGFRLTPEIRVRILARGMAEPAMTEEEITQIPGNLSATMEEIFQQIAQECSFLSAPADKPTVYIPTDLAPEDDALLRERFTVVHEARPATDDASPLPPDETSSSDG